MSTDFPLIDIAPLVIPGGSAAAQASVVAAVERACWTTGFEALILGTQIAVMTHRPGPIRELIALDLPRPRDITSVAFNDLKRHVLALIKEEATLARQAAA